MVRGNKVKQAVGNYARRWRGCMKNVTYTRQTDRQTSDKQGWSTLRAIQFGFTPTN